MRKRAAIVLGAVALLLAPGCQAPPPASTVMSGMLEFAAELSGFPEQAGEFRRVSWDFDDRAITAHYEWASRPRVAAWMTRFICEPTEQDPLSYIQPGRLLRGIRASGARVKELQRGELRVAGRPLQMVRFRNTEGDRVLEGLMAAGVIGPFDEKYHVLLARVAAPEGESLPDLVPLLEAALQSR